MKANLWWLLAQNDYWAAANLAKTWVSKNNEISNLEGKSLLALNKQASRSKAEEEKKNSNWTLTLRGKAHYWVKANLESYLKTER